MAHLTQGRLVRQIKSLRRHLDAGEGLPVAAWLPAEQVGCVLQELGVVFSERIYTPLMTVWLFVTQMLEAQQSCVKTVARFLAYRLQHGCKPCSTETGGYCNARQRLPEAVLRRLVEETGRAPETQAPAAWRWRGHRVQVVDGTTVSMPDTKANRSVYPQHGRASPGVGFPLARLVVLFSLSVGTVLAAAIGAYQGKRQGETSLWHTLRDHLEPDDVVLGDRYYGSYAEFACCRACGAHAVFRLHQSRRADFRRGQRLGPEDHVVVWEKPRFCPAWLSPEEYDALPETLTLREVRVHVREPGFRTRRFEVVTTLLDAERYPASAVAELFRKRWHAELDLRALKVSLGMDVLRCQSPDMVRKEIWAHLLAYNLIRQVMAQAAAVHGLEPRTLSFAGALQTLEAFAAIVLTIDPALWRERLLAAIASHRVGDRPNRVEPRLVKRRRKFYLHLREPRPDARKRLLQRHYG